MLQKTVNLIGALVPYKTFDDPDRASLNARHHGIMHRMLNDIGDIEVYWRRCFHVFVQSLIGNRGDGPLALFLSSLRLRPVRIEGLLRGKQRTCR
jgi:hypothetical protein